MACVRDGHEVMRDIAALMQCLKAVKWLWNESGVESVLASLNATLVEAAPGRKTYAIAGGPKLSLYSEGERGEFLEITVDAFFDPQRLSPGEYEQKVDEYFAKYEEAVAAAEQTLGPPTFNDGGGSEGFPEDQEAVWLARWDLPTARLMIQQKHEDKELPFRLCVVVTPPAEVS
jgi:hypothetical protein